MLEKEKYIDSLKDSPKEYVILAEMMYDLFYHMATRIKKIESRISSLEYKFEDMNGLMHAITSNYNPIFGLENENDEEG